ncbi:MAG: hypothetical protein VKJ24_17155 [Synechococcales bacterium]|nr:hypothetical protein [Synechococcales bacterium]
MPLSQILQENESYSFSSYFEMKYEAEEILAEFGFELERTSLDLPRSQQGLAEMLPDLDRRIRQVLPRVSLSSETARREMLVAPILMELIDLCDAQLRIEYPLNVSPWLKGTLDYLIRQPQTKRSLLVIEAKREDLDRGFVQMAVELIALSKVQEQPRFYGAVTIGEAWNFGLLDPIAKVIYQDIGLFSIRSFELLAELVAVLAGILQSD